MGIVPACFCIVPNLGFTVHLYASPGVIDFPRPCSLACTATIISKSIFCQPPLKPTQSWGGRGQRFQVIYRRSVSPWIEQTFMLRDVDNIWNGSWTQAFRYPASPGHIGLAQSSSLTFRSIIVYTSNIHLASDGPSAFKSNSMVHSSQKGPIFTVDVPVWNNGPWAVTLHDGSCQGQGWHAKPLFTYWLRLKNHLWSLRGGGSFRNGTRNVKCHCLTSSVPRFCSVFYCLFSGILSALGLSQLSELNERKGITCKGHILRNGWPFSYLNF